MGEEPEIVRERAANLWSSFERKFPMVSKATRMEPDPQVGVEDIGGVTYGPKGKILIVAGYGSDEVATFTVDPETGALTEIDSATLSDDPSDLTDIQIVQR